MTGLTGLLIGAFYVSLVAAVPASVVYLALAWSRGSRVGPERTPQGEVRFESLWGMALALPALFLVVGSALGAASEPGTGDWWLALAVAAVLGLYAVPGLALAGKRLPRLARGYPAFVAVVTVPAIIAAFSFSPDGGAYWSFLWGVAASRLGIGYLADCVVGVRFARAVGQRQRTAIAPRARRAHLHTVGRVGA